MVKCLTSARFSMRATIRPQGALADFGTKEEVNTYQDPITGEIKEKWSPIEDDPETPEDESAVYEIPCIARAVVDGGIRVAGSTQVFGEMYDNEDWVKMWISPVHNIKKRDRIVNIKDSNGNVMWVDDTGDPVEFNINGISPLFDPFNNVIEQFLLLERVEASG